jgi:hypothetical protein
MEMIAGKYVNTRTSVLGDKRSSMLESELQQTVTLYYNFRLTSIILLITCISMFDDS